MADQHLFKNVGIDSMGFYTPRFYLSLSDLAKERNVDPEKYRQGLLLNEMRIPEMGEDIVTMSLKAAHNAIIRGNINPKEIDAVFVGTETATYAVKSVSNILVEFLGISPNSITQDTYNACAGATLAIINAISMIENGIIKQALVIGADISSYELNSKGEPTQGAGAVALILKENPRMAVFSKKFGKVSGNINDFYRNVGDSDAQTFGKYSMDSYLNFQMNAFDDLKRGLGEFKADYYVFHAPFSKLPLKFIQKFLIEKSQHFVDYILHAEPSSITPRSRITEKLPSIRYSLRHFPSMVTKTLMNKGYSRNVVLSVVEKIRKYRDLYLPQLKVPMSFGNMYSASVWAQILYLLENTSKVDDVIYFGSYGSGATCISGLLKVMPQNKKVTQSFPSIDDYIQNKIQKSYKDYETLKIDKFNYEGMEYMYGKISEHENNNNNGIYLQFCDEGCLLSSNQGLNYCPHGHPGFHEIFYPLYANLKPNKIITTKDPNYKFWLNEDEVRIVNKPIGTEILEYNMRRVKNVDNKKLDIKGLLNWAPAYVPISFHSF